jgi:uncharacterized HAD superfamily protein
MTDGGGLRYNEGKLRYDLIHPDAQKGLAQVLTRGAQKYAERNWERGMKWSDVLSSLKRHLAAIEAGEDFDPETGLLHADHLQCNAHFLSAYYRIYPQGDNRPHKYLNHKKIGLDIDGVLADFVGAMMELFPEMTDRSKYWNDPHIRSNFNKINKDKEFWLNIKPLLTELPFEPHCYITARSIGAEVTQEWLKKHGFPTAPIYCVGSGESKVEVAKKACMDIFVDDSYDNFVELNKNGIFTYLYDAPYNQRYDVGFRRIKTLSDIR